MDTRPMLQPYNMYIIISTNPVMIRINTIGIHTEFFIIKAIINYDETSLSTSLVEIKCTSNSHWKIS